MKTFIAILLIACVPFLGVAQTVTQAEYFIDADAGFGKNKPVSFTPAADGTFSFTVNLSGVSAGFHNLYIRVKDSDGKWSHTSTRRIEVLASEAVNSIISGEYYFDTDPGFGAANVISVSPQSAVILQNFTAAVAALPVGYHKLYGRLKDLYGNWSLTFSRNAEVIKGTENAVLLVEYFFTSDAGFGNSPSVTFANPLPDGTFDFNIPADQIAQGADTLFVRVKDSTYGNWSITAYKPGQILLPLTLLNFSATLLKNTVQLAWQTVNEINTAYFAVERSTDGTNFNAVGEVNAKGNTNDLTGYSYDDDISGVNGNKIYYRLRQADKDGHITFSNVVSVNINGINPAFTIRPNPAKGFFTINTNRNANSAAAVLIIRSMAGQTVMKQKLSADAIQMINISTLTKGGYIVNIITPDKTYTEKLMVE